MKIVDNRSRTSNAKGFNAGSVPEKFTPDDVVSGTSGEKNKVGGTSEPNNSKNKVYNESLRTPKDPVLNAVPMPNKNKGNTKDYGMFNKISDYPTNVCGTPRPNHIS
jgi:hypothetical protein